MPQVIEACGVLIRYILAKLEKGTNVEIKLLLPALKSMCEGRSQDKDLDHIILSSILHNAKHPEHLKAATAGIFIFIFPSELCCYLRKNIGLIRQRKRQFQSRNKTIPIRLVDRYTATVKQSNGIGELFDVDTSQ